MIRLSGVRIAVLNWRDPWQPVAGGAEEHAWQVSLDLARRGAAVTFVTSRASGQRRRERVDGVRVRRMGGRFSVYPLVLAWLLGHRRAFGLVIDCMNGIPFFSPLVLPRRVPVICVIHHVHDQQFFDHFPAWLAAVGRWLEGPVSRRLYRRSLVTTGSTSTVTALRERLRWTGRIEVVPYGRTTAVGPDASPGAGPGASPASGDADAGHPALVCVGRLVAHKRVDQVVDLADELRESRPGMRVHVIGRGPEYPALCERVASAGRSGWVVAHGYLPDPDKNALVAAARLHVTASRFEGWGLTVIEAAALGVPTVAYDVDGLRDSIRDGVTGWLVREPERLADVVERALKELDDPTRRAEVARACRAWAAEFSWGRTGARMAELVAAELRIGEPVRVAAGDSATNGIDG